MAVIASLIAGGCSGGIAAPVSDPPSSLAAADDSTTATSNSDTTTAVNGVLYNDGPTTGAVLEVVGVRYDDVAHVRDQPSQSGAIVAAIAPFVNNPQVLSAGEGRLSDQGGTWWKVTVDGTEGWIDADLVGQIPPGAVINLTESIAAELPDQPSPDLDALVLDIGAALTNPSTSLAVLSSEPPPDQAGTLQVTVDVIGLDDEWVKGWRIDIAYKTVFDDLEAADPQPIGIELVSAYGRAICRHGLDANTSLCI